MLVLLQYGNFERSIKANNYSDSVDFIVFKQLKAELEKKGLKEMESPIGKKHVPIFMKQRKYSSSKESERKIIDVIERVISSEKKCRC